MDLFILFQALEEAVFVIATWVIFLPKTFLQTVFRPNWIYPYINSEWKKEPEKRFDDYLSPVVYWVIAGVLPLTYLYLVTDFPVKENTPIVLDPVHFYSNTLFALVGPIIYLAWIETLNNKPLKKSTLRRQFLIQCYIFGSVQLIFAIAYGWFWFFPTKVLLWLAGVSEQIAMSVSVIPVIFEFIAILLLIVNEMLVFRAELNISLLRACAPSLAPFLLIYIVLFLLILLLTPA